jgi:putative SOS response-associated peptidase YedK
VAAIIDNGERRRVKALRWGLIPAWAKDPAIGRKLFNARAETLAGKPSFRDAFQRRRCLIPADGFYEWTGEKGRRQAVRFQLASGEPFAFAGLYETWRPPAGGAPLSTCTIVTTAPNGLVAPVHDRMPAILPREGEALWLDPSVRDASRLQSLLAPYPADVMSMDRLGAPFRGPR